MEEGQALENIENMETTESLQPEINDKDDVQYTAIPLADYDTIHMQSAKVLEMQQNHSEVDYGPFASEQNGKNCPISSDLKFQHSSDIAADPSFAEVYKHSVAPNTNEPNVLDMSVKSKPVGMDTDTPSPQLNANMNYGFGESNNMINITSQHLSRNFNSINSVLHSNIDIGNVSNKQSYPSVMKAESTVLAQSKTSYQSLPFHPNVICDQSVKNFDQSKHAKDYKESVFSETRGNPNINSYIPSQITNDNFARDNEADLQIRSGNCNTKETIYSRDSIIEDTLSQSNIRQNKDDLHVTSLQINSVKTTNDMLVTTSTSDYKSNESISQHVSEDKNRERGNNGDFAYQPRRNKSQLDNSNENGVVNSLVSEPVIRNDTCQNTLVTDPVIRNYTCQNVSLGHATGNVIVTEQPLNLKVAEDQQGNSVEMRNISGEPQASSYHSSSLLDTVAVASSPDTTRNSTNEHYISPSVITTVNEKALEENASDDKSVPFEQPQKTDSVKKLPVGPKGGPSKSEMEAAIIFSCSLCSKEFRWRKLMKQHLLTHNGPDAMNNLQPPQNASGADAVNNLQSPPNASGAVMNNLQSPPNVSVTSGKVVPPVQQVSQCNESNTVASMRFICSFCGKVYRWRKGLLHHLKSHFGEGNLKNTKTHAGEENVIDINVQVTEEKVKDVKTDSNEANVENVMSVDEANDKLEEQVTFEQTSGSTVTSEQTSGSTVTEFDPLIFPFACHLCHKRYRLNKGLKRHLQTHSEERAYVCEICQKGFKLRTYMTAHMKIHRNKQTCHVCHRMFGSLNLLQQHMAIHGANRLVKHTVDLVSKPCDVTNENEQKKEILPENKPEVAMKPDAEPAMEQIKPNEDTLQSPEPENTTVIKKKRSSSHASKKDKSRKEEGQIGDADDCSRFLMSSMTQKLNTFEFLNTRAMMILADDTYQGDSEEESETSTDESDEISDTNEDREQTENCVFAEDQVQEVSCEFCEEKFVALAEYEKHMETHKDTSTYTSEVIGEPKVTPKRYIRSRRHKKKKKKKKRKRSKSKRKHHKCRLCHRRYENPNSLKRHLLVHKDEKPYVCDQCDKRFSIRSYLTAHKKIHTGETPHECKICHKRFNRRSNMMDHMMVHNNIRPFKCETCGSKFRLSSHLKRHLSVHSGLKPYECSVCGKEFRLASSLKEHTKLHGSDINYICKICGKTFLQRASFRHHLMKHSKLVEYWCDHCNKSFRVLAKLKIHIQIHLGLIEPPKKQYKRAIPIPLTIVKTEPVDYEEYPGEQLQTYDLSAEMSIKREVPLNNETEQYGHNDNVVSNINTVDVTQEYEVAQVNPNSDTDLACLLQTSFNKEPASKDSTTIDVFKVAHINQAPPTASNEEALSHGSMLQNVAHSGILGQDNLSNPQKQNVIVPQNNNTDKAVSVKAPRKPRNTPKKERKKKVDSADKPPKPKKEPKPKGDSVKKPRRSKKQKQLESGISNDMEITVKQTINPEGTSNNCINTQTDANYPNVYQADIQQYDNNSGKDNIYSTDTGQQYQDISRNEYAYQADMSNQYDTSSRSDNFGNVYPTHTPHHYEMAQTNPVNENAWKVNPIEEAQRHDAPGNYNYDNSVIKMNPKHTPYNYENTRNNPEGFSALSMYPTSTQNVHGYGNVPPQQESVNVSGFNPVQTPSRYEHIQTSTSYNVRPYTPQRHNIPFSEAHYNFFKSHPTSTQQMYGNTRADLPGDYSYMNVNLAQTPHTLETMHNSPVNYAFSSANQIEPNNKTEPSESDKNSHIRQWFL